MKAALASRFADSERQRAENDRFKTEFVLRSPIPLVRFARHSSVTESSVFCDTRLRCIQVPSMEEARTSGSSGSGDPKRVLNSRARASADSFSGMEYLCWTIPRQYSRSCCWACDRGTKDKSTSGATHA